jgi:hypothetical protein
MKNLYINTEYVNSAVYSHPNLLQEDSAASRAFPNDIMLPSKACIRDISYSTTRVKNISHSPILHHCLAPGLLSSIALFLGENTRQGQEVMKSTCIFPSTCIQRPINAFVLSDNLEPTWNSQVSLRASVQTGYWKLTLFSF